MREKKETHDNPETTPDAGTVESGSSESEDGAVSAEVPTCFIYCGGVTMLTHLGDETVVSPRSDFGCRCLFRLQK